MKNYEITNEELENADIREIWYTNSYGERVSEKIWFDSFDCDDWEMSEILRQDEEFRRWKSDKEKFLISEEDEDKSGVYKIQLGNKIYIGQTKDFKLRFNSHCDTKTNKSETANMIRNGATFEILEIEDNLNKRLEIETKYIDKYKNDGFILINKIIDTTIKPTVIPKQKLKKKEGRQLNYISFNSSDLEKITKLLSDNNIEFKQHKFRDEKGEQLNV